MCESCAGYTGPCTCNYSLAKWGERLKLPRETGMWKHLKRNHPKRRFSSHNKRLMEYSEKSGSKVSSWPSKPVKLRKLSWTIICRICWLRLSSCEGTEIYHVAELNLHVCIIPLPDYTCKLSLWSPNSWAHPSTRRDHLMLFSRHYLCDQYKRVISIDPLSLTNLPRWLIYNSSL